MSDAWGREVRYLRLSVTDRCNCRCRYCMPAAGVPHLCHEDLLTFEELVSVVRATTRLGVRKVRLTGGEPLVRRGIVELVRMLRAVPEIEELALTTNATLLEPLAGDLKGAGLDWINVSLDSLDAERYEKLTRCGSLAQALAGIAAAREAGFEPLKVNAVLVGGANEQDIAALARLARDEGLYVRFIELMPLGPSARWPKERFVSADRVLDELPELEPVGSDGVAELYAAPGWRAPVGLIRPMTHRFCGACDRIRVTCDGRFKPCLHAPLEVPLRGLSEDEMVAVMADALARKPQAHGMDVQAGQASASLRPMSRIGG